jgi:hypothetical protein
MSARNYGHVAGVPVGATFSDRMALSKAGVHRATQAGITGGSDGTESIVLNAGYSDDVDRGDEVIYTGHGGRNPNTGRQESDQELEQGNKGLAVCCDNGLPVRHRVRVPLRRAVPRRGVLARHRAGRVPDLAVPASSHPRRGDRIRLGWAPAGNTADAPGHDRWPVGESLNNDAPYRARHGTFGDDQGGTRLPLPSLRHPVGSADGLLRRGSPRPTARITARRPRHLRQRAVLVPEPSRLVR